ncbi:ThiF family adenylyltransferase [Hydrogenophaga bisanensis]|uniref:ThiF family adenylyltransferase n=1 Tax=Hydrogenophaga bisanensis TaxID=439611 RepID=A0ABW2RCN9_9BURK
MTEPDHERRFGGLRRLLGQQAAQKVFDGHVVVVGIGGVGSWAAEALARSGMGRLTLVDMDHVAESNVNRQIHALDGTLGMAKVLAMRDRIQQINPGCQVHVVDDFVTDENWPAVLEGVPAPQAVVDACDQVRAKVAMAHWAVSHRVPFVSVGAAGGKRFPHRVELGDLAEVTHDPLLAQLRYRLRKHHGAARQGRMGVSCVFSKEAVRPADASCSTETSDHSLNCHGYGSSVAVTATFGMCAAAWVMNALADAKK